MPPKNIASQNLLDALQDFFIVIATIPKWQGLDAQIVQRNKLILRDATRTIYACAIRENLRESKYLGDDLMGWIRQDGKIYDSRPNDIPLSRLQSTNLSQPAPILLQLRPSCNKLLSDDNFLAKFLASDPGATTDNVKVEKIKNPPTRVPKRNVTDDDETDVPRPGPATKKSRATIPQLPQGTSHSTRPKTTQINPHTNQKVSKEHVDPIPTIHSNPQEPPKDTGRDRDEGGDDQTESHSDQEPAPITHNPRRPIRCPSRDDLPTNDLGQDLADVLRLHINQSSRINEVQGHCHVLMEYYTRERGIYRKQISELKETVETQQTEVRALKEQLQNVQKYLGLDQQAKQPSQNPQHPARPHSVPAVPALHNYQAVTPQFHSSEQIQPPTRLVPNTLPQPPLQNPNPLDDSCNFSGSVDFQGAQFVDTTSYPSFPDGAPPNQPDKMFGIDMGLLPQNSQPAQ